MGRVIVITSGKGGVGKTTTTANIGMALAQRNRKVVVVDADFGLRNLDLLLGLENRVVYTAVDVLSGQCRLEQALVKDKRRGNLVLLPAAQNRTKDSVNPAQMRQLIAALAKVFDYVLVDSPAGIEMGFQNAIAAATEAIVVTTPEISAVRDADRVIGLLEANNIKKSGLIINRIRPKMVAVNDMMSVDDVTEILAIPLLGVVPDDEKVIVSTNKGEPLVLSGTPTQAGTAFENIARRLDGEKVEFLDLMVKDDLLSKIKNFFTKSI
ncbi:MAG: septum site-determining protein MinD [Cyanobacteria bacterium]|nr:septum site-determining protein MinD [Cyanobacteriota bacterium]